MKKGIACSFLGLLLLLLTGCAGSATSDTAQNSLKITIVQDASQLEKALQETFPDINFEFEYYMGASGTEYLRLQLLNDDMGDIFLGTLKYDDETCREHLMDLSGYDFVGQYESAVLNQYDVDGALYLVPGPIMIRTMAYNKTLFEEMGWQAPKDHGELVRLVKKIRAESELTPIAFAGAGLGYYFTTMTTYAQTAYIADARWREWEKSYLAGDASCREGFQPGIDMLQQLIDADAYDVERYIDCWDGDAIDRLISREAAMMVIWGAQSSLVDKTKSAADEFVLFPFYNENGEPFLGTNISRHIGLAKHLENDGNEKKLENALRVMKWLSTPEGMSNLNVGSADILPLTAVDNLGTAKVYRDVWTENLSGLKAPMLYTGYEDVMIQTAERIQDAMINGKSLDGLTQFIDDLHQEALHAPWAAALGNVAEQFTHEETVQLMAEVLYGSGLADVAMVSSGGCINGITNPRGVSGKLYPGDLYASNITVCLPGSVINAPVEVMTLTGRQICDLAENGKVYYGSTNVAGKARPSASFGYYWAGMDVEWRDGKVYTMTLNDGRQICKDSIYTVAFAQGDYTGELGKLGNSAVQSVGCQDLFKAYLLANGSVVPPEPDKP